MLEKRKGEINEIVYNNTVYNNGRYSYYPTITDLNRILEEIMRANATTEIFFITPFYFNEQIKRSIEFQEYIFCIECRESVDAETQEMYIKERLGDQSVARYPIDTEVGEILYPLCKNNDSECFKQAIALYKNFLKEMLPQMMKIARIEMDLKEEDIPFGYFCFEIISG